MLRDLLIFIIENRSYSPDLYAKKKNISLGMVQMLYQQLIDLDYVEESNICPPNRCESCSSVCFKTGSTAKEIIITEKGWQAYKS